ncbi:MAG: CvpA family protein [Candidatus Dormibacteria bacterium]
MLSATDSTLPQLTADAVLVVLILVNALLGWRTGTLRRLLSAIALYAAFLGAYYTGNGFASLVRKGDIFANAWAFVAILVVVVIAFEIIGRALSDRIEHVASVAFDRVAGMLLGAAVGFFQAAVLFMVALAVGAATPGAGNTVPANHSVAADAVRSAAIASHAIGVEPALRAVFAPLISTDLTTHLENGTQLTSVLLPVPR